MLLVVDAVRHIPRDAVELRVEGRQHGLLFPRRCREEDAAIGQEDFVARGHFHVGEPAPGDEIPRLAQGVACHGAGINDREQVLDRVGQLETTKNFPR